MNTRRIAYLTLHRVAAVLVAVTFLGCPQRQAPTAAPERTTIVYGDAVNRTPPRATYTSEAFAYRAYALIVPAGTEIQMTLAQPIGSATSQVDDIVTATTTVAVLIGDRIAIPVGCTIHGRVSGVDPASTGLDVSEKGGAIALAFSRITTPDGYTTTISGTLSDVASSKGKTAGIIVGSAAGGAILGRIIGGHTKDAALGAVLGGGIGTGIAAATRGTEVAIPAGTQLAITLDEPLAMTQRL